MNKIYDSDNFRKYCDSVRKLEKASKKFICNAIYIFGGFVLRHDVTMFMARLRCAGKFSLILFNTFKTCVYVVTS